MNGAAGFIVVLSDTLNSDQTNAILTAIKMIKGVASVNAVVPDAQALINREQVKREILTQIRTVVEPGI